MVSQRYLSILRRRFPLVILIAIVGLLSATFFSLRQPKVYQATATLLINPAAPSQAIPYLQAALGNSGSPLSQLASTYDVYLTSYSFDQAIIQRLGLPDTPSGLAGRISSALIGNTNFYRISATGPTPEAAQQLANEVAAEFIRQNESVLQSQAIVVKSGPAAVLLARIAKEISQVSELDQKLVSAPDASSAKSQALLATVEARLSSLTTSYSQLLAQNGGSTAPSVNTAALTNAAQLPTGPISPAVRRDIALGGAVGVLLGLMLVFAIEFLEYSIRTPEDLEEAVGQLPLAVIAQVGSRRLRHRSSMSPEEAMADAAGSMYTVNEPRGPVSEAFRTLRTNLAFSVLNHPVRTMVVASVLPGEGKSTVAANLAVVMAQSGKRVILVDADLRRPSQHQLFNVSKMNGLTDVLVGTVDLPLTLRPTVVPNLRILPCGTIPPNPAELLSSDAVKPLITALKNHADLVIFDTPPLGALTDAVVLSTLVEGTLMVVRAGSTRPNVIKRGLETLRKVGARPVGIVLNRVVVSELRDYSSYYYYYAYQQADEYSQENNKLPSDTVTASKP